MSSRRLPGKVLMPINGKPLLAYVAEILGRSKGLDQFCIATSTDPSDDSVAGYCEAHSIKYFRGSLEDVALRYFEIVSADPGGTFVRICCDSPLLDHRILEKAVQLFNNSDVDLVTNVFPRSFPGGQSVEVIRNSVFLDSYLSFETPADHEHVTGYFYRTGKFRILNFSADQDCNDVHMAVDTQEDAVLVEALLKKLEAPAAGYRYFELATMMRKLKRAPSGNH